MPRERLTDALVAKSTLPNKKSEAMIWDSEVVGFGLRIRAAAKTFVVMYRPAGAGRSATAKRYKVGSAATIKTAEARSIARSVLGRVAAGHDPAAERAEQKRRETSRVRDILDRYDKDLERRNYVDRRGVVGRLRKDMASLLDRDIATVTGAEIALIMERMAAAGRAGAAQEFRGKARTFFGFAHTKAKVINVNPLAGFRKDRSTRAEAIAKTQHGRAFSDDELARLWAVATPDGVFNRMIRFLILTGCRRNEGAILAWPMVDRAAKVIHLPAALIKQGRPHDVPIAPLLSELLDSCPIVAGSDYVFSSEKTGGQISGWRMREKLDKAVGFTFGLHDLRRTFRTGLSRLGVDDVIAELAIGHKRPDLEARYNRDLAEEAIRNAFERWDAHVAKVTTVPPKGDGGSVFD